MKRHFLLLAFLLIASTFNFTSNATAVLPYSSTSSVVPTSEPSPEEVRAAVDEFKSLSKKERKARIKEVKKQLKQYKKDQKAGEGEGSDNTVLLCILAVLLPPLAVYLHEGEINSRFWISLLLTLLFWLPGVIYALIIILGND